jgi:LCP family protein required for cell wall assembly
MQEAPSQRESTNLDESAGAQHRGSSAPLRPPRRNRRARRIALVSLSAVAALLGLAVLGGFLAVRHLENNIQRIPNVFAGLDAAARPVMPAATRGSMTVLLTGSATLPGQRGGAGADGSSTAPQGQSGLIALVHINANGKTGAIVSIPPNTLVHVPGHGLTQLDNSLALGGPSLLIRTVEGVTNVRVSHYSVVDFDGLASALAPLGGVNVDLPAAAASDGVTFHPGINHLNGVTAMDYVRQSSLSEEGRVLRQQALLRAVLDKIAHEHLLGDPASAYSTLNAFTKALSVDSDFTNSGLQSLAMHLHLLGAGSGTFVSAPVQRGFTFGGHSAVTLDPAISRKMWAAIRNDDVTAFATQFPSTVTPVAPN